MDFDAAGSRPKTYLEAAIRSRRRASTPSTFHPYVHHQLPNKNDLPKWAMLDPYVQHQLSNKNDLVFTYVSTGSGDKFGISSEIAKPTMPSFLFYQWVPGDEGIRGGGSSSHKSQLQSWDAKAVAAHHNSILLRFVFPTSTGTFPDNSEEFFVYQPLRPPPRSTLVKLPPCRRHNFMNCDTNTGILCRENGEFVVAHLSVIPGGGRDCQVTAELCCLFGEKGSWCTSKSFPICHKKAHEKLLNWWETDTVVSFGDFICWVDYLRGILLCDVYSPSPKVKYVPLPIKPYRGRCNPYLHMRGNLSTHRSVCVTSGGSGIKFVDVTPSHSWLSGRVHELGDSEDEDEDSILTSTINSWTLVGESWVKDDIMTPEEIIGITSRKLLLECPLVDPIDPDTIYFTTGQFGVLEDSPSHLITINMKTRTITGSSGSYSNKSCSGFNEPFLPWIPVAACRH